MNVKIVACTKPEIEGIETAEEFTAFVARVSNPANQLNTDTAEKLLRYCLRKHHWSVFEHVYLTMEISTTRDIARQILRHRSFTFQEFSQRYADPTKELRFYTREARLQDPKNRQGSLAVDMYGSGEALAAEFVRKQETIVNAAKAFYEWAVTAGIAKEQARCFLPEGLTESRLYMTGSLRSWIHYCDLRTSDGTQKEHRLIAVEARRLLWDRFATLKSEPVVHEEVAVEPMKPAGPVTYTTAEAVKPRADSWIKVEPGDPGQVLRARKDGGWEWVYPSVWDALKKWVAFRQS